MPVKGRLVWGRGRLGRYLPVGLLSENSPSLLFNSLSTVCLPPAAGDRCICHAMELVYGQVQRAEVGSCPLSGHLSPLDPDTSPVVHCQCDFLGSPCLECWGAPKTQHPAPHSGDAEVGTS